MNPPFEVLSAYFRTLILRLANKRKFEELEEKVRLDLNRGADYSVDWFCSNSPYWITLFDKEGIADENINALEIGSYEGRSAKFILEYLPRSNLTAVDVWESRDENNVEGISDIEKRFDSNLKPYKNRLTKFKGTSFSYFSVKNSKEEFDFIYIDGSHRAEDVVIDAFLAFRLLKVGGILIFDDYLWRHFKGILENPAPAIHAFLRIKRRECQVLLVYHQMCIKRIA